MHSHRLFLFVLVGVVTGAGGCAPASGGPQLELPIRFDIEDVSPDLARDFETWTREARRKVDDWWVTPFGGQITVVVRQRFRISKALVPAWRGDRGDMEVPARRVKDGMAAMVHELTHVVAPNSNRFLAEGLSTHAQEHLNGHPAFPNFGTDLHQAAKALLGGWTVADVARLERIPTPDRLMLTDKLEEMATYILAGSFVRWSVEVHGEKRLRDLYALTPLVVLKRDAGALDRWRTVFGVGFGPLVEEWRRFLER